MDTSYNDSICSRMRCRKNEFSVVKNPMTCKKGFVLFLISHRKYVLDVLESLSEAINSNKYPKHMCLEVLTTMFLHNF